MWIAVEAITKFTTFVPVSSYIHHVAIKWTLYNLDDSVSCFANEWQELHVNQSWWSHCWLRNGRCLRLGKSIQEVLACVPPSRASERDKLQGFVGVTQQHLLHLHVHRFNDIQITCSVCVRSTAMHYAFKSCCHL